MKHLLTLKLLVLLCLCFSLNRVAAQKSKDKEGKSKIRNAAVITSADKAEDRNAINMKGAYSMLKQVVNNGTTDSLLDRQQFKIYTNRYMMYAANRPGDSLADYGIGTYTVQNGKVKEYIFHTASGGARNDTFELEINKLDNGYTQVIDFPLQNGKFILTEDYRNVGKSVSSPLEGAWKQIERSYIPKNGTVVTDKNPTQYKVYQSGHFIWAITTQNNTTNKTESYFGYGTYEPNGNNSIQEINTNSTFRTALVGKPVTIQIEFLGDNSYKQTMVQPNGDQIVEVYKRLD